MISSLSLIVPGLTFSSSLDIITRYVEDEINIEANLPITIISATKTMGEHTQTRGDRRFTYRLCLIYHNKQIGFRVIKDQLLAYYEIR